DYGQRIDDPGLAAADLARVGLEVVAQSGVLLEPPQRRLRKHNVRRALRPLRLELPNGLGPISGVVAVAALVVTREMPGRPAVEREERVVPVADDQHDAVLWNGLGDERAHACHEGVLEDDSLLASDVVGHRPSERKLSGTMSSLPTVTPN